MPECEPVEAPPDHIFGRGLTVLAKEKSGWTDYVGMSPTIADNSSDVSLRIEAGITEQFRELLAHGGFDLCVTYPEELHPCRRALLRERNSRERERVIHC